VVVTDLTQFDKTEKALQESEAQYKLLFQSSPVGIFHFNQQNIITQLNDKLAKIIQSTPEQMLGLDLTQLNDKRFLPALKQALEGREGLYEGPYQVTTSELVIYISMRTAPIYDESHRVKGGIAIVQDITERIHVESALRHSEDRFRQVIASIPDYIYVAEYNPEGFRKNLFLSPKCYDLTGYSRLEFLQDNNLWPSLIIPDDRATAQQQENKLKQGIDSEAEYRITPTAGGITWVRDSARVETHNGSKLVYGVISDISQRKQLEGQLYQSQKLEAIGRLAGGIAHDFNNILTVIIGNSELLLDTLPEQSTIKKEIEQINNVGSRAASLTRQLLAFSRQQLLQPTSLNLNTTVVDMDKMLRRLIGEDINLITLLAPNLGQIRADRGQIEQVIVNMAVNARDAMPQGGNLTIQTDTVCVQKDHPLHKLGVEVGTHAVLIISDNGIGMADEIQAHIFEPFFTTKEQGKGTGLGLATIHGIVTQSGGHVFVESQPNQGATFKMFFPQIQVDYAPDPVTASDPPLLRETATVLVVEDDDLVRSITYRTLLNEGYIVLEAGNSVEAITLSQTFDKKIDLLLTDVIMPGGMDGIELANRLRQQRPAIKILFMSGYTQDSLAEFDTEFLQKPFSTQGLLQRVHQILLNQNTN
jgi:PAS domain S-box-containing protein